MLTEHVTAAAVIFYILLIKGISYPVRGSCCFILSLASLSQIALSPDSALASGQAIKSDSGRRMREAQLFLSEWVCPGGRVCV